jgi:hypothetical protein
MDATLDAGALALDAYDTTLRGVADVSVAPRGAHVCARGENGAVRCVGAPSPFAGVKTTALACGDTLDCVIAAEGMRCKGGLFSSSSAPAIERPKEVSAGSAFACAVDGAGRVVCWGETKGTPPARPARHVRAGVYHACVIDTAGKVGCWGDDRFGQLGGAGVVADVEDAIDVAVGEWHTCALERSGRVLCWGRNARGQLGDGTTIDRRMPGPVALP